MSRFLGAMTLTIATSCSGLIAAAQDVGEADFVRVSELADYGYEPFAVSSVSSASFGMKNGASLYLCFLADNDDRSAIRRGVLLRSFQDPNASRTVPNIAVICVAAE